MEITSANPTENIELIKSSLCSWKRIIWNKAILVTDNPINSISFSSK